MAMPAETPLSMPRSNAVLLAPTPSMGAAPAPEVITIREPNCLSEWLGQVYVLTLKNILFFRRSRKIFFTLVIAPVAFMLLLWALMRSTQSPNGLSYQDLHPPVQALDNITRCTPFRDKTCITIAYTAYCPDQCSREREVVGTEMEAIMQRFARASGLSHAADIFDWRSEPMPAADVVRLPDGTNTTEYLVNNQNRTHSVVVFCAGSPQYQYTIVYNASNLSQARGLSVAGFVVPGTLDSLAGTQYIADTRLALQRSIDEAIITVFAQELGVPATVHLGTSTQAYPRATPPVKRLYFDPFRQYGTSFLFCALMFNFVVIMYCIVQEKDNKLNQMLRMIGMRDSAYWFSWIVFSIFTLSVTMAITIGLGYGLDLAFFRMTDVSVIIVVFGCFGLATTGLAVLVSAVVKRTRPAVILGMLVFISGLLVNVVVAQGMFVSGLYMQPKVSPVYHNVLYIYAPFNFAKAVNDILNWSYEYDASNGGGVGTGYTWTQFFYQNMYGKQNTPSTWQSCQKLLYNALGYVVLAWYLGNTITSSHARPRPWYFPLQLSYWGLSRRCCGKTLRQVASQIAHPLTRSEDDEDIVHERERAVDDATDAAVRLVFLTKTFSGGFLSCGRKKFKAVRQLCLAVERDQLLCILGKNGAGKSTTFNMLTGLEAPTGGDAFLNGLSINHDMDLIRKQIAVCPQHDVLWDELTPREHLRLICGLKRVPRAQRDAVIAKALADVSLSEVIDRRVGGFSGGMKRRVSVAMTSIGDPKIVFMDEPTTGMDPISRSQVWEAIRRLKTGRVVILTTHAMAEADALADRVAIVAHGELRCVGTPLHLKTKYGDGMRLSVVATPGQEHAVAHMIGSSLPSAELVSSVDTSSVYRLPAASRADHSVTTLFAKLEMAADTTPRPPPSPRQPRSPLLAPSIGMPPMIQSWGISCPSLEQVFMKITLEAESEVEAGRAEPAPLAPAPNPGDTPTASGSGSGATTPRNSIGFGTTSSRRLSDAVSGRTHGQVGGCRRQCRALMVRNAQMQRQHMCQTVCQLLVPIVVFVLLALLQNVVDGVQFSTSNLLPAASPSNVTVQMYLKNVFDSTSNSNQGFFGMLQKGGLPTYWVVDNTVKKTIGHRYWLHDGGQGFLNGTEMSPLPYSLQVSLQRQAAPLNPNLPISEVPGPVLLPVFVPDSSPTAENMLLQAIVNNLEKGPDVRTALTDPAAIGSVTPWAILRFDHYDNVSFSIDYTIVSSNDPTRQLNDLLMAPVDSTLRIAHHANLVHGTLLAAVGLASKKDFLSIGGPPMIITSMNPFPQNDYNGPLDLASVLAIIVFPLIASFLLPLFVSSLVAEKEGRFLALMRMNSLRMRVFWPATFFYDLLQYLAVFAVMMFIGWVCNVRLVVQTSFGVMFVLFFLYGCALVSFGFFLAAFIGKAKSASIGGYLIVLFLVVTSNVLNFFIYQDSPPSAFYMLLPTWVLGRAIYLMSTGCMQLHCATWPAVIHGSLHTEMMTCWLYLLGETFGYAILAAYLEKVVPRPDVTVRSPLFPFWDLFVTLRAIKRRICKTRSISPHRRSPEIEVAHTPILPSADALLSGISDDNVLEEQRLVADYVRTERHLDIPQPPIVLDRLVKDFPQKRAVNRVSLRVNRGECMGMLGPNGAGKTTTLSMVAGMIAPTTGRVFVDGRDTRIDREHVWGAIAVCPQFDTLWDALTVEDHLVFYARLKGVPEAEIPARVRAALRLVRLETKAETKTMALSGGMKRRLSMAICLVGYANTVLLDEPTTGLDPLSKEQAWEAIRAMRAGRAVILTTHSMEEADLLCDRLAIIAGGQMCCLGSPWYLKDKFSHGYRLVMTAAESDMVGTAVASVKGLVPGASIVSIYGVNIIMRLPDESVKMSELFEHLQTNGANHGVANWAVSQTTLEDVFLRVVLDAEGEANDAVPDSVINAEVSRRR